MISGAVGENGRVVVGAAGHVDGVSHRGPAGKDGPQFFLGFFLQFGDADAQVGEGVGGNGGVAAAVGQDGDAVVFDGRQAGEGLGGREEFVRIFDDDDAGPFEGTFGHLGHAGQGAGVGPGRAFAG
jgi:hypothetical protein